MKTQRLIKIQYFWTLFIGLGAVAGATGMISDPSGKAMGFDQILPYFQVLPFADVVFQDFTFSGISLFIVNGFTQLVTFFLLLKKKPSASLCSAICGIILMLWIFIQFYIFPFNFMSTIYFVFGALEALGGFLLRKKEKE